MNTDKENNKNNTNDENITNEENNKQQIKELGIRNQYLRSNINKMLGIISTYREEIKSNEEIIDTLCKHKVVNDYLSYTYDERPQYCKICNLYK